MGSSHTGDSRALCTTEIAVHTPLGILPNDYYLISIKIPEQIAIKELNPLDYPKNWRAIPFNNTAQEIGDKFVKENKYLLLKVPSVVVSGDFNYLINPLHKDFKKVAIQKIERFVFDKRLFK
ncbi:RES family NAD+ phosphorylase [Arachidicoccus soli]|uniref:RES domain-containing protein n=1 Tax=Arachidicoccus soli TaxID=2341117 RepID=A0A386HPU6_9BACT|nr:RES family NAD+ phosphorylase [Arachidicoccus soli]AYD47967.1 RES domain-containing protein [Arachidicoccus soli]